MTLALLGQLTGIAWQTCEVMADQEDKLQEALALDEFIKVVDSRFGRNEQVKLPEGSGKIFRQYRQEAKRDNN